MRNIKTILLSLIFCAIIACAGCGEDIPVSGILTDSFEGISLDAPDTMEEEGTYQVVRIVDGDTIVVKIGGNDEKVRLIGIDTPESVHPDGSRNVEYGEIASNFTRTHLEGKEVSLEFDVQERDRYGRILAYVYLDGKMFNKTLLEE